MIWSRGSPAHLLHRDQSVNWVDYTATGPWHIAYSCVDVRITGGAVVNSAAVLGARYGDDLPKAPVFNPATAAVGEVEIVDSDQGNRQRGLDSLADALSRGATAEEVRELARVGQRQRQKMSLDRRAGSTISLAVFKGAKIPSKDGAAVVAGGRSRWT